MRRVFTANELKEYKEKATDREIQLSTEWNSIISRIDEFVRNESYLHYDCVNIAVGCNAYIHPENIKKLEDLGYKVEIKGGTITSINAYFK